MIEHTTRRIDRMACRSLMLGLRREVSVDSRRAMITTTAPTVQIRLFAWVRLA
jgi:hypothetical protein